VILIPEQLAAACHGVPERMAWLGQLPKAIEELQGRWGLALGQPFSADASCSWVAPALSQDGTRVVLKLGMPHMEAEHEIEGLRFWDGNPTVCLLKADSDVHALLLERCEPGTSLRNAPDDEADVVLADLFRRMWRRPPAGHRFRPLSMMLAHWAEETRAARERWTDPGLVQAGLRIFEELSAPSSDDVVLATDLHAGNVLRAQRAPWLVIDPKPFVGDRAYDPTQHLLNCQARMSASPHATIRRFADLLAVDSERVRLWMFARSAAEPREAWTEDSIALARALA
jgi:streptomycin 6-kinase